MISVITGVSVLGVAVGVAALIVVLSVMNGFFDFVRDMLVSVDPHIRIESVDPQGIQNPDSLIREVSMIEHVVAASSFVQGKALLMHEGGGTDVNKVVIVRGVGPDTLGSAAAIIRQTRFGKFDLERRDGLPGVVVGLDLSSRLGLVPGDGSRASSRVELLSALTLERMISQFLGAASLPQRFEIRGVYDLDSVSDESTIFVDLVEAQRLFRLGDRVTSVEARLDDVDRADAVKEILQARLDPDRFRVSTWYDLQKSLYDVMALEKWAASAILVLIVIVAAFNIVGSLTMVVIEKRRDVGVLRAMGVSRSDIRRIFLNEGFLIGIAGTGAGIVLGVGLVGLQAAFDLVPLAQAESFLIDAYPVALRIVDVLLVSVVAMALCVGASVYPAWRASRVEPAAAVRAE
jgi:lipoprotein-releasing system permease protein